MCGQRRAGGHLLIGVADDLTVVGVADPLREQERLANLVADSVSPKLVPLVEMVTVEGKTLLVATVALSNRRPHFVEKLGKRRGVFVRLGASNRQADGDLIKDLERGTQDLYFDQLPVITQSPDDLDAEALEGMLGRPMGLEALRTLDLVVQDQGRWVPTNGGVLLAGKERERVFPFAYVQCARFRGERRLDIFDHVEVHEHLPLAVDKVMDFLKKHAFRIAEFGDVRRRDVWSIPVDAVREVIINSLVHASYSVKGSPVRVAFCDDRIEVDSPGGLLPGIAVEDMIRGTSSIRNPVLARVFAEMDLIEQWGTGVPGVFAAVAAQGLPVPEITELPKALRFTIFIQNHHPRIEPVPGTDRGASGGADPERSGEVAKPGGEVAKPGSKVAKLAGGVDETDLAVLNAASRGSVSRLDLLAAAGLTDVSGNYRRRIATLVDAGLLARTIPDKPTSPLQRYALTEAGRALLERCLLGPR
ncbi:MAG: putative DNA binding domain-containing protein, partial [Bifidobacteriaceae bacterium]|nr:putative DNA binding domain-containing protein [Bifidobacteriaceae bacterium]